MICTECGDLDRPVVCKGRCHRCDMRHRRGGHGRAAQIARSKARMLPRLMARVRRSGPSECWNWTGSVLRPNPRYPHIQYPWCSGFDPIDSGKQRATYAYRLIYQLCVGPIPAGMTVDHICFNTLCCNPSHLQLLTLSENAARKNPATKNRPRQKKVSGKGTRDSSQSPSSIEACVMAHASSEKHTASPRPANRIGGK